MPGNLPGNQLDVKAIFNLARKIESDDARAEYLQQVCEGDAGLIHRVTALLHGFDQQSGFLESPPAAFAATTIEQPPSEAVGTMIGPYKLREVIGEGGMGIVYVAEQERPIRRKVALKVIKPGMDTREVIARFEAERQALALMDHPNIAKVLDAGTVGQAFLPDANHNRPGQTDAAPGSDANDVGDVARRAGQARKPDVQAGRPYFVMELVRGLPITEYCDKRRLSPRERLKLFITVCEAVQHAHQRGIIHRDIKPSNVMITMLGEAAVPKVIDFGVAKALNQKLTEHTLYTRHAQMVGTPLYMSPEQAELTSLDVDTRSDVYSLGVLLYELLTGQTPFDKEMLSKVGFDEMRRMIREDEPPRPSHRVSTLAAQARSTVSNHRSLEERHLARTLKGELDWIVMKALEKDRTRRYGSADALAADLQRYLDDKPVEACPPSLAYRARKLVRRKRHLLTTLGIVAVCAPLAAYGVFKLVVGPDSASRDSEQQSPSRPIARAPGRDLPGLVPEPLLIPEVGRWQLITKRPRGVIRSAVWSPDEKLIALAEANHVRIYDATTQQLLHVLVAHNQPVRSVAWHPDGRRLASASEDGTVRLWTSEGIPTHLLAGHSGPVYQVAWRPDGGQLASCAADGTVRLWNAHGSPIRVLDEGGRHVFGIDWSPDGKLLASAGGDIRPASPDGNPGDHSVRVWDVETGALVRKFDGAVRYSALCVDWRPDGKQLAVGYGDMYRSTGANSGSTLTPVPDAGVRIWNIDGTSGPTLIRESETGTAIQFGTIYAVAWAPAGERLAFGGRMGGVRLWHRGDQSFSRTSDRGRTDSFSLAWKRDSSGLLSASRESVREWNPDQGEVVLVTGLSGQASYVVKWSPDGQTIASHWGSGLKGFLDADGKPAKQPEHAADSVPAWWEVASQTRRPDGTPGPTLEGTFPTIREWAWSKNGWLAGAAWADNSVRIWNDQGKLIATLKGHRGGAESVDWSPDAQWLAFGAGDSVRLWKADGTPGPVMTGHTDEVYPVAWSPDGKWIASGSTDSTIRLWKPDGTPGPIFRGHQGGIHDLAWSPDSNGIASASWLDSTLRVWNVEHGKTEWQALRLDANAVTLSATGQPLHGDRELLELALSYVVEGRDGSMELLTFGEFRRRHAVHLVAAIADRCKQATAKEGWNQAEAAFADALTFLPDGGPGLRNQIAHVAVNLAIKRREKLIAASAGPEAYARTEEMINRALEIREPLVAEAPDNMDFRRGLNSARYVRGNIRFATGHIDDAIVDFQKAIELNPQDLAAHNSLGILHLARRQYQEAADCLREMTRVGPKEPVGHHNLGLALSDLGRLDEAIASVREGLRIKPDYPTAHSTLGWMLKDKGLFDEAIASYREAIRLEKNNGDTHAGLGEVLYAIGRLDEAIAAFREAIRLKPDSVDAHRGLGEAFQAEGRLGEAIASFRESVRLNMSFVDYRINTGSTSFNTYGEPRISLGNALYFQGQLNEAVACYRDSVEHYQQVTQRRRDFEATSHEEIVWFLANCPDPQFRDPAQALALAQQAVALAPQEWRVRQILGVCLYRAGDCDAAIDALQKSIEQRSGGNSIDWFFLAMAHRQLGHNDEARAWYDKAIDWMEQNQPRNPELQLFRTEAAEVLTRPVNPGQSTDLRPEPVPPPEAPRQGKVE